MTIQKLGKYSNNYINKIKKENRFRDIRRIWHNINYSKKSDSVYIIFTIKRMDEIYKKTIRISDHAYPGEKDSWGTKIPCYIVKDKYNITAKELKGIKKLIVKEMRKLNYRSNAIMFENFKAEDY